MQHLRRFARPSSLALALLAALHGAPTPRRRRCPRISRATGAGVAGQQGAAAARRAAHLHRGARSDQGAYVEPVDDKTLLENAIKGMLSNLDPHSAYLEPEAFADLQETTSGEFGGLGIEVGIEEDGFIRVVAPIDDTPASKAGLEAGDLIVKIDGHPTKGMTIMQAVEQMRGKPGTEVSLTLVREGGKPFDVTLTRSNIKVKSVKSQLLEPNYGYLRITQFQVASGEEVAKALASMRKENGGKKLEGLVLDLRNNPGGVLQSAVEVADHFLTKGLIVYTKGRIANSELRFSADPADASEAFRWWY